MLRAAALCALAALTTGCTRAEVDAWLDWFDVHPRAAMAFARNLDRQHDGDQGGGDTAGVYEPWISLAECESNGNWHIDSGNGYYGGLQFALRSWHWAGGSGNPADASPSEQVRRGEILQDLQGWGAWPTCARRIGLL
jgi:Transglycosylase-like domain